MLDDAKTEKEKNIIQSILDAIKKRLGDLENSTSLTVSTFLDPRFKNLGFSKDSVAEVSKNRVTTALAAIYHEEEKENEVRRPTETFQQMQMLHSGTTSTEKFVP